MFASTIRSRRRRTGWARAGAASLAVLGLLAGPISTTATAASGGSAQTYVVRRGDTLIRLASRFGTTVGALVRENGIADRHRIIAGKTLRIPATGTAVRTVAAPRGSAERPGVRHEVRRGETVSSIARRYGIRASDLAAWNGIVGGRVYTGTRLVLFNPGPAPTAGASGGGTHVVARGENLGSIARRYGTSVSALAAANGLRNPNRIIAGARLQVPGGRSTVTCPVPGARFVNDWGYPRAGGKGHAGIDLFARRGTPVVAPVSGVVRTATGRIGGLQLWLTDSAGNTWFGSHLDSFGKTGSVRAGDLIGRVGNTGNARRTSPHLHLEYRPAGGSQVNPYPLLRQIC